MAIDVIPHGKDRLSVERTVPRSLVHRLAISEVFLTDSLAIGEDRFVASAQLPVSHMHFSDLVLAEPGFDPLLLLECCRQTGIYGAHVHFGLPLDTVFLVREADIRTDERMPGPGREPAIVYLHTTVLSGRGRAGRPRAMEFRFALSTRGRDLGTARFTVDCVPADAYRVLRQHQRGGEPPLTSTVDHVVPGDLVAAGRVGRRDPRNVLLAGLRERAGFRAATLVPRFDNTSIYEHVYDHHPGMVLAEAARQLAVLAADGTPAVTGLSARFRRFAELDVPVELRVRADPPTDRAEVAVVQADAGVAEIAVEFSGETA